MKPQLSKLMKIFRNLGLVLGYVLFLFQITNTFLKFLENSFFSINWIFISLAFLIMMIIYFIQIKIWLSSMSSIGIRLSLNDALLGYWVSFIPRYIPGSIWGYFSRSDWFYRERNIPYGFSNTGSIIEALVVVVGGFTAIIFTTNTIAASYLNIIGGISLILLSGAILNVFPRWAIKCKADSKVKVISLPPGGVKILSWFQGITFSLLNWTLYGLILLLVVISIFPGEGRSINTLFFSSINIYSIAWLIGFIVIIVPGGLGIRESILAILLTNTFRIEYSVSVTIAVLVRLISLITELIWITVAILLLKKEKKQKQIIRRDYC